MSLGYPLPPSAAAALSPLDGVLPYIFFPGYRLREKNKPVPSQFAELEHPLVAVDQSGFPNHQLSLFVQKL